jgi:biopolymer transport protein ExbB/TolQ
MTFIEQAGFFAWPIIVCAALSFTLAVVSAQRLARGDAADARTATGIDGVLFWGGFAAVVGLLGTLGGVAQAAQAIERAGEVSTPLVWAGLRVALHPLLMGLLAFCVALLGWFALRTRQYRAVAGD